MKRVFLLSLILAVVGCAATGPTEAPKPSTDETHNCGAGFHWETESQGNGGRCVINP